MNIRAAAVAADSIITMRIMALAIADTITINRKKGTVIAGMNIMIMMRVAAAADMIMVTWKRMNAKR